MSKYIYFITPLYLITSDYDRQKDAIIKFFPNLDVLIVTKNNVII